MKDISNDRQPSFLLMKVDDNGNKYWRLNYNIVENTDEDGTSYYECDFVPNEGGVQSEESVIEIFREFLLAKGLTETEINNLI